MAISKKDVFSAILALDITEDIQVGDVIVTPADITETLEKAIEQLDSKAAKAREKAAEKKAAGDELRVKIKDVLTDEYQTLSQITAALGDPDITNAMVTPRINALVKLGEAHKADARVDNRTLKVYALGPAPTDED